MTSEKIIEKIYMDCPLCDHKHELLKIARSTTLMVKGDLVTYDETFFRCLNIDNEEDENEFETGKMLNQNILNAKNAYRKKHNLLTSDDIIEIREKYNLSQVNLSKLLGWKEDSIARYETKSIQSESCDATLRLIKEPVKALEYFENNKERFTFVEEKKIRKKIKEIDSRERLLLNYRNYNTPSIDNGFTVVNIDKIEATISYFAEKLGSVFKVKLMKMLWYADAISFKERFVAITGLVYTHEPMGALPIGHNSLMNLENLIITKEESDKFSQKFHIHPSSLFVDYSVLTQDEIDILNRVVKKFKDYTGAECADYMHKEKAYRDTKEEEIISFELTKELNNFDEI